MPSERPIHVAATAQPAKNVLPSLPCGISKCHIPRPQTLSPRSLGCHACQWPFEVQSLLLSVMTTLIPAHFVACAWARGALLGSLTFRLSGGLLVGSSKTCTG